MIRKLAICAVVALAPSFAFAAGTAVPVPVDPPHAAVSGDAKADASVKTDTSAKPDKGVHHRKAKAEKTKAGVSTDTKANSSKL